MDATLKTYSDGSELTVGMVAFTAAASLVLAGIGGVAAVKWDAWTEKRIMKKHKMGPYAK